MSYESKRAKDVFTSWERLKRQIRPLPPVHLALWREQLADDMRKLERQRRRQAKDRQ